MTVAPGRTTIGLAVEQDASVTATIPPGTTPDVVARVAAEKVMWIARRGLDR